MFIINCVILYMMNKITHNIDGVMGLQKCINILRTDRGPGTGTYQISSDDGNQVTGKRGKEVTYIKVEEDPWPATSAGIATEPAVSFVCVYVCVFVSLVIHMAQISRISCPLLCFCLHKTA